MTRLSVIIVFAIGTSWAQQEFPELKGTPATGPVGFHFDEVPAHSAFPDGSDFFHAIPIEIQPPAAPAKPAGESVSIAQLQHKVPKEARKSFARAAKLVKADHDEDAMKELETAVRVDPDFADAYEQLGIEYGQLGRASDAATAFRRLLELRPDSARGDCYLGLALLQMGQLDQSEKYIGLGLRQSPDNAHCQFLRGYLLLQHEATRADGLRYIQNAARILPFAKEFLHSLH